jgi:transcriptional regulator with XRE-family HTH domain
MPEPHGLRSSLTAATAQYIRRRRGALGLSQQDLADKVGVTRAQIKRLEGVEVSSVDTKLLKRITLALRGESKERIASAKFKPTQKLEPKPPSYPNCELLAQHEVEIAHIERFLKWLSLNGYSILEMGGEEPAGTHIAWESVGINLREIEAERKRRALGR